MKHKKLSREQQKLVEEHLWVAGRQAYHHYSINGGNTGVFTREDLESVGRYALCVAASRWEESRGVKFSTYAWTTVSGYIQHSLRDHSRMVKVPRWILYSRHQIKKRLDAGLTVEGVLEEFSLTEKQFLMVQDSWKESYKSLDYRPSGESNTLMEIPFYDRSIEEVSLVDGILERLAELTDTEMRGLERYLNGSPMSQDRRERFEAMLTDLGIIKGMVLPQEDDATFKHPR